ATLTVRPNPDRTRSLMGAWERLPGRIVVGALLLIMWGCGESGSNPPELPEVHFLVTARGSAQFGVDSTVTAGVSHPSIEGQEFVNVTNTVDFVVEGAQPPYSATFTRTGTSEILVELSLVRTTGTTGDLDKKETSGDQNATVTVQSAQQSTVVRPRLE